MALLLRSLQHQARINVNLLRHVSSPQFCYNRWYSNEQKKNAERAVTASEGRKDVGQVRI